METQISLPSCFDMCLQTVDGFSNLSDSPSENNHNVIVQTLPISITSTEMQTINEYPLDQTSNQHNNYFLPNRESLRTSCLFNDFLLHDLSTTNDKNDSISSILLDFDTIHLLDNGTQTYPSITIHETQTMADWDNMLLTGDEWIQTRMNG